MKQFKENLKVLNQQAMSVPKNQRVKLKLPMKAL